MTDPSAAMDSGLCPTCKHISHIETRRSTFIMCNRSKTDPTFPKYPKLPVLHCRGYELEMNPKRSVKVGVKNSSC